MLAEMYYSVSEVALLLRLHPKTVIKLIHAKEFAGLVNLGGDRRPDYRIPVSGLNAYLSSRRVVAKMGTYARTMGELRRKAGAGLLARALRTMDILTRHHKDGVSSAGTLTREDADLLLVALQAYLDSLSLHDPSEIEPSEGT